MVYTGKYESPIGLLGIRADKVSLTEVSLNDCYGRTNENGIVRAAIRELDEYFCGKRKFFDIPLNPRGTPFQLSVWESTAQIPYGKNATYSELAATLGGENLARAVGSALKRNPILIFIPCHRIIGKNGNLTGFSAGMLAKEFLLTLESEYSNR